MPEFLITRDPGRLHPTVAGRARCIAANCGAPSGPRSIETALPVAASRRQAIGPSLFERRSGSDVERPVQSGTPLAIAPGRDERGRKIGASGIRVG